MECPQIPVNPDVSGRGVRTALYAQSALTVILIQLSPHDAAGAYWSMTIDHGHRLDLLYLLLLPILASAFGISRLMRDANRMPSPLLILINWIRSALTYALALWVWATASTFGESVECNPSTKFILFGASLPATGSGRTVNMVIWGIGIALFGFRFLRPSTFDTLFICIRALFSSQARYRLLRARRPPPSNEWIFEQTNYEETELGKVTKSTRENPMPYRQRRKFYTVLKGLSSLLLGTKGTSILGTWFSLILATFLAIFAIVMTELELRLNKVAKPEEGDSEWAFGQILPLLMTIQPVSALIDVIIINATAGPGRHTTTIRLTVRQCMALLVKGHIPSAFCVITCRDQLYATYEVMNDTNPIWYEAFDIEITDLFPITIRVFHLQNKRVPILLGHTTFLPLDLLSSAPKDKTRSGPGDLSLVPHQPNSSVQQIPSSSSNDMIEPAQDGQPQSRQSDGILELDPRPLWKDGQLLQGTTLLCSLSTDVSEPIPPAQPPTRARYTPTRRKDVQETGWYFKIGYGRFSKTWYSRTDRSRVRV
ncbi:hypothetical protein M408DRAFT_23689 [Serendipita vermifera MAFF 305830]|uniref:C2 domain-containing protein n=1 Tax=Serendipita vermifera MAFF 305830 TaxID=933852 RepID=A0A0C2XHU2_SERVB|nr:hypothetical protein M408DRAFT_23689 [Serendipita vermifera MAFF 305830]